MKIINKTDYPEMQDIGDDTIKIMGSDAFHAELSRHTDDFECSNINGPKLSEIIKQRLMTGRTVTLRSYWYWRRKVAGKYDPTTPGIIYFNKRNLKPKLKKYLYPIIKKSIGHEITHLFDGLSLFEFHHCGVNKYDTWMNRTAPYIVGRLVEKLSSLFAMPEDNEEIWMIVDHDKYQWTKFKNFLNGKWFS